MTLEDHKEIEELQLDDEELELIAKFQRETFEFPVISVSKKTACFNSRSSAIVPKRIKWYTTSDYVIGVEAEDDDPNGYKAKKVRGTTAVHMPTLLMKEKCVKEGYYKLFKYKTGFAFKRYEQYVPEERAE